MTKKSDKIILLTAAADKVSPLPLVLFPYKKYFNTDGKSMMYGTF